VYMYTFLSTGGVESMITPSDSWDCGISAWLTAVTFTEYLCPLIRVKFWRTMSAVILLLN
jgi:hypothetical protein